MPENNYAIKRRGDRQKVDFRVQVQYFNKGNAESAHGRGSDLSEGGMAVYAAAEIEEGQHIKVEFTLPYPRRQFTIEAVVRNKQGYRYGLEFVALSSLQREDIKKLCETTSLVNSV